jgi:hypothetical protein
MRKILLITLASALHQVCWSQTNVLYSISHALRGEYKVFVGFHNRNTFILSEKTKLFGLVGGLDFEEKVKFYVGVYGFGRADKTLLTNRSDFSEDSVYRTTNTAYFSLGVEYDFYERDRLSLSIPVQLGLGTIKYNYTTLNEDHIRTEKFGVSPLETGINAHFAIVPCVGIKAGTGYRINIGPKESRRLSSPYYNIGLSVLIAPLYQELKEKVR